MAANSDWGFKSYVGGRRNRWRRRRATQLFIFSLNNWRSWMVELKAWLSVLQRFRRTKRDTILDSNAMGAIQSAIFLINAKLDLGLQCGSNINIAISEKKIQCETRLETSTHGTRKSLRNPIGDFNERYAIYVETNAKSEWRLQRRVRDLNWKQREIRVETSTHGLRFPRKSTRNQSGDFYARSAILMEINVKSEWRLQCTAYDFLENQREIRVVTSTHGLRFQWKSTRNHIGDFNARSSVCPYKATRKLDKPLITHFIETQPFHQMK